jgi:hypothetical protein
MIAQRDRMLILHRCAFDVEIERVHVVAIDHRLVFRLQAGRTAGGQRSLLAGGAAK